MANVDDLLGKTKPIDLGKMKQVIDVHILQKKAQAAAEQHDLEIKRAATRADAKGGREADDIAAMRVLVKKYALRARGELIGAGKFEKQRRG